MLELIDRNISGQEIAHTCLSEAGRGEYLCPACEGRLIIKQHYVACHTGNCSFTAGAPIDLLAAKLGSYMDAMKLIAVNFRSSVPGLDAAAISMTAKRAEIRRRLVTELMQYAVRFQTFSVIDKVRAESWFRKMHIELKVQPRSVVLLTQTQWASYRLLIGEWDAELRIPRVGSANRQCVAVIPYFTAPGRLAALMLLQPNSTLDIKTLHLEQARFTFTGLMDLHPAHEEPVVRPTFYEAAESNTTSAQFAREEYSVAVMHKPDHPFAALQWAPQKLLCSLGDTLNATSVLADLAKAFPDAYVAVDGHAVQWDAYALEHAFRCAIKNDDKLEEEFHALKLADTASQKLMQRLIAEGFYAAAARVDSILRNRLLFIEDGVEYHRDGEHYVMVRDDGSRTVLSNFILELEKNVVFADSKIFAHSGAILFNERRIPCVITTNEMNSISTIETAAQTAEFHSGAGGDNVPMFRDKHKARALVTYFRDCLATLARVEGMNALGWNEDRTAFFTPWGKVTEDRFISDVRIPNPNYRFWGFYRFSTPAPDFDKLRTDIVDLIDPEGPERIPLILQDLISQIVAMMARSYAHMPERVVRYQQDGRAQAFLSDVFGALSQVRPIVTTTRDVNMEKFLQGVNGFPLFLICHGDSVPPQSAVILGDKGKALLGPFPAAGESGRLLREICARCLQWIMRTRGTELKIFNSIDAATALTREGSHIIRQALDIAWIESHPISSTMEEFLNSISPDRVQEFFTNDLLAQIFEIDFREAMHLIDDAIIELIGRCKHVKRVNQTTLTVDAMSGITLLTDFYGTMPVVKKKQTPEDLRKLSGGA